MPILYIYWNIDFFSSHYIVISWNFIVNFLRTVSVDSHICDTLDRKHLDLSHPFWDSKLKRMLSELLMTLMQVVLAALFSNLVLCSLEDKFFFFPNLTNFGISDLSWFNVYNHGTIPVPTKAWVHTYLQTVFHDHGVWLRLLNMDLWVLMKE